MSLVESGHTAASFQSRRSHDHIENPLLAANVRISFFNRSQTVLGNSECDRMAATKMDSRFIFLTPFF